MEVDNSCDIINHMLLKNEPSELQQQYSFLVHSSIYPMVQKYLTRSGFKILQQLGRYELTVGAHTFDMEILVLESYSRSRMSFTGFKNLIENSQLTYFWDKKITLFQEVDRYYQLEEFIACNDLNKHIISVEEISGINSVGAPIKLVTFDNTIDRVEILFDFVSFLYKKRFRKSPYRQIYHYYFTNAYPWHQPEERFIYITPFRNERIYQELQTFLTCMRELTYTREPHLDLVSLCSLKLAFCDDRNLTVASCDLEYEIDALIERFLRRIQQNQTYIENGNFDLYRYAIDANSTFNKSFLAIVNLVSTFQHIFHHTSLPNLSGYLNIQSYKFTNILKLIDENTDLKILRAHSNISYEVDGEYYENMNSKLFCELLKCGNVYRIYLDTNHKWTNEPYLIDFGDNGNGKYVTINLMGTNQFNFIEDFIQFLKTIPSSLTSKIVLVIEEVTLNSYHILKNLEIEELYFVASMITFTMLTELSGSTLKILKINFEECTIEDRTCTWSALIKGFNRKFVKTYIFEGENTWQYLFESIANHLTKFKLNEFKFQCNLRIRCQNHKTICFRDIKFMFDEFSTQLEMRGLDDQIIDFYYLKNFGVHNETTDDYKNFEFYQ